MALRNRQGKKVVHFRNLENPKEDGFCLDLSILRSTSISNLLSCDDVTKRVANHLGLDDSTKIRLTYHKFDPPRPRSEPIAYKGEIYVSSFNQTSDILYYEVLDTPLLELQGLKALNISFHHATKDEVLIRGITLPLHSTVGDVINDLKTKVEVSHPNAELRLLDVYDHHIHQIFPPSKRIMKINNPHHTLRAEEIPVEEKRLSPHDRLIDVYHFTTDGSRGPVKFRCFGEPFLLLIHEGETIAEVKVRIQNKLHTPEDEFSKWRFKLHSSRSGPSEYLQDTHSLGLEHSERSQRRPDAANQVEDSKRRRKRKGAQEARRRARVYTNLKKRLKMEQEEEEEEEKELKKQKAEAHLHTIIKSHGSGRSPMSIRDSDDSFSPVLLDEEDEMLVPHSENIEGLQLMEAVEHAEKKETQENQLSRDPPSSRFTWRIENFSRLNSKKQYSDIFSVNCYKWRLLIYPKGNNVDHFSIYLEAAEESNLPIAKYIFAVVNQIDNKITVRRGSQHQFALAHKGYGFKSFMLLSDLIDPCSGFLVNDTCIIEAEVAVYRPRKKKQRELAYQPKTHVVSVRSKKAVPQQEAPVKVVAPEMYPVTVSVRMPETRTELDGKTEVPLTEQVSEPAAQVECASPMPHEFVVSALSQELTPLPEYPGAGQLFEEGRHCYGFYDEKFENIGGFNVTKAQAFLYKQIWLKYGHIASSQVITSSYIGQVCLVVEIMNTILAMHRCHVAEVSSAMINTWEEKIKMAETLKFNIKWLRERFDDVKKDFNGKQSLEATLLERDQSLQMAKARLVAAEAQLILAQDAFKMVHETVSGLETSIGPLISEKQKYVERGKLLLFDGLF